MRKVLPVVLAALAVVIAGCTSGPAAPPGGAPGGPAGSAAPSAGSAGPSGGSSPALSAPTWRPCPEVGQGVQCASLQVPLDYSKPGGRKITLALSEVPAKAPAGERQGVLLVNPGGPGGAGRSLAAFVANGLDPAVAARYTIVGFDTRGVGASVPALHCDTSFFAGVRPNYIPASRAAEQVLIGRARRYAAGCEKKFGWLLPFMTTGDLARDMDSIRTALGQQKISYFAYSYGTYLGQVYATLFPGRVRRMVLDSTVDPGGAWYADNIQQDYAFEGRIESFFAWAARYDRLFRLGATAAQVRSAWYKARRELAAHPLRGPSGPVVGPDEYDDTFVAGGYANAYWPGLASALSSYLRSGSGRQLITQYDQEGKQNENEFAVYNAVECSDVNWPRNWSKWNSDTARVYATAPFEAWSNAWFNAACAFWPVRGAARPPQISGAGLPGILMLQGTLDAATPYAGAQAAHRLLPSARMVVVEGGGNHGQSLASPPNACVNGYLNRYLATGALPERAGPVNAACPALPDPVPSG
jgi:pimeloyl-ACP methyl ester carboxylesterase